MEEYAVNIGTIDSDLTYCCEFSESMILEQTSLNIINFLFKSKFGFPEMLYGIAIPGVLLSTMLK